MPQKFLSWITLDHRSLGHQPLFWLAMGTPFLFFLVLGCFAWYGASPQWDFEGFNNFISRSRLPLGVLALAVPLTALVASIHKSIQTAKQIEHTDHKKAEEDNERTLESAKDCLEKAYELLNDNGQIKLEELSWKNSAAFIAEFELKKKKIQSKTMLEQLEVWEDYWRAKFEELLALDSSPNLFGIKANPAVVLLVAGFSTWRKGRLDSQSYAQSSKLAQDFQENPNTNEEIKRYFNHHKNKIGTHSLFTLIAQSINFPDPKKVFEDAVNGPPSNDPIVRAEQERRGLIPNHGT